jgi:outer membrane protein assembly factor BamB
VEANRPSEALQELRTLEREYPRFEQQAQADVLTVLSLEKRHLYASARRVLQKMSRHSADQSIRADGEQVRAADFVRKRLEAPAYRKQSRATVASPPKAPPARTASIQEDQLIALLPIEGIPAGKAQGLIPIGLPRHVRLIDGSTGQKGALIPVPERPYACAWFGEELVVRGEQYVLAYDVAQEREAWRYASETPIAHARMVDEFYCVAVGTTSRHGFAVGTLIALNAAKGEVVWRQEFPGAAQSIEAMDETILLKSVAPERVYLYDIESGNPRFTRGLDIDYPFQLVSAAPEAVVLAGSRKERSMIVCLNPTNLQLAWSAQIEALPIRIRSSASWVVAAQPALGRVDFFGLKNGKLTHRIETSVSRNALPVLDGNRLYLMDDDALKAYMMDQPVWSAELGRREIERRLEPAGEYLILWEGIFDEGGKFGYRLQMLDRSGKLVKRFHEEPKRSAPYLFSVSNEALLVAVENTVEVYR